VKAGQVKGDELAKAAYNKNFTGLPIPAAASCAVSLNLFLNSPLMLSWYPMDLFLKTIILGSSTIVIGFLMISKCKFLSVKALRFKIDSFYLVFLTVIVAIFMLYGIIHHFALVFVVVAWGYLIMGCILTLIRLIAGKKSKTLEGFDPHVDEQE